MTRSNDASNETPTTTSFLPTSAADLWGFLAFSHGWTWLFWGIVVSWGVDVWSSPLATVLFAIGGLGRPIGATLMTGRVAGRSGLRDLGRRIVDPGRISAKWWIVILFLYPAIKLAGGGLAVLFGLTDVAFHVQEAAELGRQPIDLLVYLGFVFLLGPLPEEIGWRGYLLDRLQLRHSALGTSVLVGIAWFAWHGPLFLMAGYYSRAGGAPDPLQFGVAILLGAVLYT